MGARREDDDPRVAAAQYRIDRIRADVRDAAEAMAAASTGADAARDEPRAADPTGDAGSYTASDRAAYVEQVIRAAIRRGEFDDLPGAGKPIPGLGTSHDPDWWIRRKIEREGLTGLGPPALQLRVEHAALAGTLDALAREDDVRSHLEDFNRRVRDARLQLLGGPPVVTPTADVDAEIAAWAARRAARDAARGRPSAETAPRPRRLFGRARRTPPLP
ncbi:DnaJ family domain-containing protein [Microbacterium gilvum]|uniref:DnaJ homologue subfamily C member 28 conserved domain-containing protein n=1 Tax=Microbacterium gilvum TaxID=1336204 RepID=A0ABP8ZUC6_9MICO